MSEEEESTLWKGSPSQWLNIGPFAASLAAGIGIIAGGIWFPPAFAAIVLPAGYALWKFLVVRCRVFELTGERLRVTSGVINQKIDEIELYRVKDTMMLRKWWMRITGLSNIVLETSDRTMPRVIIPAISKGTEVREMIRKLVEARRDSKRVREMDFDDVGDSDFGDGDFDG